MHKTVSVAVIYLGGEGADALGRFRASVAAQTADVRVHALAPGGESGAIGAMSALGIATGRALPDAAGSTFTGFAVHDGRALWRPGFLSGAVSRLEEPDGRDYGGVYSRTVEVFEKRNDQGDVVDDARRSPEFSDPLDLWQLLEAERIWAASTVFRPEFLGTSGGLGAIPALSLRAVEEWYDGWVLQHRMAYVPRKMVFLSREWSEQDAAPFAVARRRNERVRSLLKSGVSVGWAEGLLHTRRREALREDALNQRIAELEGSLDRDEEGSVRAWESMYRRVTEVEGRQDLPSYDTLLEGTRVLSLDIFETCLHRKVGHPLDLLILMREDLLAEGRRELSDFVGFREEAARIAMERHHDEARRAGSAPREDLGLVELYRVFCELAGVALEEAEPLARREFEWERKLAYPNQWTLGLEREARNRGITVIFVSDMHHPAAWLRELLDDLGYGPGELYVSSETGYTKQSGGLFKWVFDRLGGDPADFMHVGDNPRADVDPPNANGWRSFHLHDGYFPRSYVGQLIRAQEDPNAVRDHGFSPIDNAYRDLPWPSRIAAGIARWHRRTRHWDAEPEGSPIASEGAERESAGRAPELPGADPDHAAVWRRVGFECVGPMAFFYAAWVWRQARERGSQRVFFLARDGYYLQRIYRKIASVWGTAGEDRYLFASRRLLQFAAVRNVGGGDWEFLLKAAPGLRARDFLARIGVASESYRESFTRNGFPDLDEVLTGPDGWIELSRRHDMYLVFCDAIEAVVARAREERERLHAYLREQKIHHGPALAVDLGWHGSSVDALTEHLRLMGQPWPDLEGCYFASWRAAESVEDRGCLFRSYFAHLGAPAERVQLLEESIALIESFFSAPHGTVIGLRSGDDGWQPICDPIETGSEGLLEAIWEGAEAFAEQYLALVRHPVEGDGSAYVAAALERLLRYPSPAEAAAFGGLPHREGWAAGAMSPIVPESVDGEQRTRIDAREGDGGGWATGSAVLRGAD